MNQEAQKFYIPINIKTRTEIFEGYGIKELMQTIFVSAICLVGCLIFYASGGNPATCVVLFLSITAGAVMFTVKDRNNTSVVDQISYMIQFSRSQKKYKYIYMDEWR